MVQLEMVQLLVLDERRGIVLKPSVRERLAVVGMVKVSKLVEWEEVVTMVEQGDLVMAAPGGLAGVCLNHLLYFLG